MSQPGLSEVRGEYADWKAPTGDGGLLIWPAPRDLLGQTLENLDYLSRETRPRLLGVPLAALRREARRWIGHLDDDRPIVATGHQCELYHPGVWIKNVMVHAAAAALHGQAYHFAVDTDSPKHLTLRWPGAAWPITDDPKISSAAWAGLLDAPSEDHRQKIARALDELTRRWGFSPAAGEVVESLRRLASGQPRLVDWLSKSLHALDWSLGLRHLGVSTSPMLASPPYLVLAASLIADARRFATAYNSALRGYRAAHGTTTNTRPMPDLFISDTSIEMPFWLDNVAQGRRTRPSVFDRGDGKIVLKLVSGEEIAFDPGEDGYAAAQRLGRFLDGTSHRLSPRALTLTLFIRLFIADQFVHGIGGGRYDQVLDRLVFDYFGIAAPRFAVATATMLFPASVGRARACVPCVVHEGHQLRHRLPGQRKRALVERIELLPRRSRERRRAFDDLQATIRETWQSSPEAASWQQRLEATREQAQRDVVEFDRELFYALQPRERLAEMVERVVDEFA